MASSARASRLVIQTGGYSRIVSSTTILAYGKRGRSAMVGARRVAVRAEDLVELGAQAAFRFGCLARR
jgi:hypothetical protein